MEKDSAEDLDRIVLEPECERRSQLSRSTRYREELAGRFPRRIKLSKQRRGWRLRDIVNWINNRPA